jgi:hypothetical protein
MDVGFNSVTISEAHVNEVNLTYIATGKTNMHYSDSASRYNDELYVIHGSLLDVMIPAEGESENDSFYFPNPNKQDKAFLKFGSLNFKLDESMKINFVDIQGRNISADYIILSKDLIQINTEEMSVGTYVGSVVLNGNILTTGKLVIEK